MHYITVDVELLAIVYKHQIKRYLPYRYTIHDHHYVAGFRKVEGVQWIDNWILGRIV